MQHSYTSDTSDYTEEQWVEHFWVSRNKQDLEPITYAVKKAKALEEKRQQQYQPCTLQIADILRTVQTDQASIIAALVCDEEIKLPVFKSTHYQPLSETVYMLVANVHSLNRMQACHEEDTDGLIRNTIPEQAELLRRMLLAMVDDVRAVLIVLATRLEQLRLLSHIEYKRRHCIAQETLNIFAPLANRLGVSQLKWELEDLSFRHIDPITYKNIAKSLNVRRVEREVYIDNMKEILNNVLKKHRIQAKVYGRPKHIYSIFKKMQRKQLDGVDDLYDLRAIRIIVNSLTDCYQTLGFIHEHWKHIPEELDDYIANKKPNGYQSLHTVIIGPRGRTVEIQIRTEEMHIFAELGVAAHWRYKEGGSQNDSMERAISSLRYLLDQDETDSELLEDFRTEIFPDRVFVLTPKGDIRDLPKGSTPLDFAYSIHTSIGHRCRGAKVNGRIVPLTYALHNGETVEVMTGKEEKPKRSWIDTSLGYVRSARAKNSIRHWFRQQNHDINKRDGLSILERELKQHSISKPDYDKLFKRFHTQSKDEFLIAVGRGDISIRQLSLALAPPEYEEEYTPTLSQPNKNQIANKQGIQVEGVSNMMINIANCCKPVPGDPIIGYITLGRGVSVHRDTCPNINVNNLTEEQQSRLVDVNWGSEASHYAVDILITGYNQPGLLRDVTNILAGQNANIQDIQVLQRNDMHTSKLTLTIQIHNTEQLDLLLQKISELSIVIDARRFS